MWKKLTSSTSLAGALFLTLTKAPSPFASEKLCTYATGELAAWQVDYTVSWMHQQKLPGKNKSPNLLGSLHSETVSWNTGEGHAMARHLYSTWPERDGSVPRAKSSHAALKTESESNLQKNFQGFGTHISYMLSKSHSSASEVWKQTEEKTSELFLLQYYTLISILLFLFICYFRVTKFW